MESPLSLTFFDHYTLKRGFFKVKLFSKQMGTYNMPEKHLFFSFSSKYLPSKENNKDWSNQPN
ncbi:hypothetical protein, partial [Streptococcus suis]|uniref:hypothetical protein n=1 Tax=Streptococcus suis TaxID=1307 RepID=UPI003704B3AA